jgi:hypothetical protein
VDTLVVRAADVDKQKAHLHGFIRAWFRALNVIQQDKERAYPIMGKHEQVPTAQIEETMGGLLLLDKQQNLRQFAGNPSALFSTSMDIQRILKESGLMTGSDDLSQLINPYLIEEASLD